MAREIVVFDKVYYSYPKAASPDVQRKMRIYALEDINLSVKEGEFLAVMGENGSGKTTFCKLINGIIPNIYGGKLTGTVIVNGVNTINSTAAELARITGIVMDDPDIQIFTSSVRNEAAFGPENLNLPKQEIEESVKWALSVVGLEGYENRRPGTLSGGEKQRLAIAASLAMKTKIIVLDEPLCRLDPEGSSDVVSVLRDIREKHQITIIMTTNDSKTAFESADRVCVLKKGRAVVCDNVKTVFNDSVFLEENGLQPPAEADVHKFFITNNDDLSANKKAAITVNNLSYSYDKNNPVIDNLSLTVAEGDFTAIIGRNGCGKTTLLKNITGLLKPCSGDIFICGKNSKNLSVGEISKDIGFVMQNPDNQLFTNSVYKEVSFALKNARFSKQEIKRRVEDALERIGLDCPDAFPHALNRADRVKTVIACVLAMGCRIIVFDEVDIGQDYRGSRKIMDIAKELNSNGTTVIFITHNISLVCEYAKRLIIMDRKGIITGMRRVKSEI